MFRRQDIECFAGQRDIVLPCTDPEGTTPDHFEWGPVLEELNQLIDSRQMGAKFGAIRGQRVKQRLALYIQSRVKDSQGMSPKYDTVRKVMREKVYSRWVEVDGKRT